MRKRKKFMSSNSDTRAAARNRAQSHFAAAEQRDASVRAEIEKERTAMETKTAKLRALRLAKEEEERVEAERLAAEESAKKAKAGAAKKPRKTARKAAKAS